jgi:hypothetical protein
VPVAKDLFSKRDIYACTVLMHIQILFTISTKNLIINELEIFQFRIHPLFLHLSCFISKGVRSYSFLLRNEYLHFLGRLIECYLFYSNSILLEQANLWRCNERITQPVNSDNKELSKLLIRTRAKYAKMKSVI